MNTLGFESEDKGICVTESGATANDTTCLLALLRRATAPSHAALDQMFSEIDIVSRDGYVRFLSAHLAGLVPVFEFAREFARAELGLTLADLPAMLRSDLAELEATPTAFPVPAPAIIEPAAISYVVAGSRLGVAALARQPFYGKATAQCSRYMDDKAGLSIWRSLVQWLEKSYPDEAERQRQAMCAIATFDCFATALSSTPTTQGA